MYDTIEILSFCVEELNFSVLISCGLNYAFIIVCRSKYKINVAQSYVLMFKDHSIRVEFGLNFSLCLSRKDSSIYIKSSKSTKWLDDNKYTA